jgi:hypothetical protein
MRSAVAAVAVVTGQPLALVEAVAAVQALQAQQPRPLAQPTRAAAVAGQTQVRAIPAVQGSLS